MSRLTIYPDDAPHAPLVSATDPREISAELAAVGVGFERWQAGAALAADASQNDILVAYAHDIDRLRQQGGYVTADVVSLKPDHPDRATLRLKFLDEHTHSEDEVRFFVEGSGAFYLHLQQRVYQITCERGDLLRVPANTCHWFDMGPAPHFTAIRLFIDPAGWVGHFTGDKIANEFPRHGE
ncbi:1,2-dihydroxy-3-keto-5-methylthiopentene dioxygenase [Andreprevotia chitinilytica]|uniref:1,2-dihydroxy-3-keto-5-methylthiopentene dioxygenase n=1 Tax=Andreprevotia chitinilytica TaxID=396808 RepID=UPI000556DEF0|nr:hypothetical protein [Andreprevotia chitinilytica]